MDHTTVIGIVGLAIVCFGGIIAVVGGAYASPGRFMPGPFTLLGSPEFAETQLKQMQKAQRIGNTITLIGFIILILGAIVIFASPLITTIL